MDEDSTNNELNISEHPLNNDVITVQKEQETLQKWSSVIEMKAIVLNADVLKERNLSSFKTENLTENVNIFSIVDLPRLKDVIVFETIDYNPSEADSWKKCNFYMNR